MVVNLVRTANEIVDAFKRRIKYDRRAFWQADRADKAFNDTAFKCDETGVNFLFKIVAKLCFINFKIASDEYNNVFVRHILLVNNSFAKVLVAYGKVF